MSIPITKPDSHADMSCRIRQSRHVYPYNRHGLEGTWKGLTSMALWTFTCRACCPAGPAVMYHTCALPICTAVKHVAWQAPDGMLPTAFLILAHDTCHSATQARLLHIVSHTNMYCPSSSLLHRAWMGCTPTAYQILARRTYHPASPANTLAGRSGAQSVASHSRSSAATFHCG